MSGSTIGGVVGAVVGFVVSGYNPQGAYWGWMIGAGLGGAVAPETIKAPSIGDAQQQSSQPGIPRPVIYGHPAPFAGNIIDGESKARKIKVKQKSGKGGPKVESERFLLTSAVRICEGPVKVIRIWRNGEVVYDVRDVSLFPEYEGHSPGDVLRWAAQVRARSKSFQNRVRIYEGTEDQLPDPALEAIHGVGNTPYYRGTAYMVIENDDVTDTRGAAAQYRFEVVKSGVEADGVVTVADALSPPSGGGTLNPSAASELWSISSTVDASAVEGVFRVKSTSPYTAPVRVRVWNGAAMLYDSGWIGAATHAAALASIIPGITQVVKQAGAATEYITDPDAVRAFVAPLGSTLVGEAPAYSPSIAADGLGSLRIESLHTYAGGASGVTAELQHPDPAALPASVVYVPDQGGLLLGSDGVIYRPSWAPPLDLKIITPVSVALASVVADVANRCNVPDAKLDVSALTDFIPGFLVAEQFTGADALRPTQQAFFYDLPEVDGAIRAVRRGASAVVAITDADLVETDERDERVRPQAIEYPLKVSVVTQDPAAEYAATPQTSGRLSPDFQGSSEVVVQLPIPMSADQTAQIAHKLHKVIHSQAEGQIELTLPVSFSRYVPSDAFTYGARRWMIEEARYGDGIVHWKATYDRVSAYSSSAKGQAARPPALPNSGLAGPTVLAAMNLPRLRTADSTPGMYLAARGIFASWPGCIVQVSIDGGETFQEVATITAAATIGSLATAVDADDTTLDVALREGDELESVTAAQLEGRANGYALGSDTPEVGQFQTATETTEGAYTLTGVTRGQLGTTGRPHLAGAPFVLLDGAVLFVPLDLSLAGRTLIFRPVTSGADEATSPTYSVVYRPQFTTLNIDPYLTASGDPYTDSAGSPYYRIS